MKYRSSQSMFSLIVLCDIFAGCATAPALSKAPAPKRPDNQTPAIALPQKDKYGAALLAAADKGDLTSLQALLNQGADVNAKDSDGNTALILASRSGHPGTVKLLLDQGAEINAADTKGETSLIEAAVGGHTKVVRLLLAKNANTEAKTTNGLTASMAARKGWYSDIVTLIQKHDTHLASK